MLSAMEHDTPPLGTNPDPDPDNHRPPRPCRLRRLAIGLALGITTAGVPTFGIVTTSGASGTDDASAADEVVAVNVSTGDCNADALPADVRSAIVDVGAGVDKEAYGFASGLVERANKGWIDNGGQLLRLPPTEQAKMMAELKALGAQVLSQNPLVKAEYEELLKVVEKTK